MMKFLLKCFFSLLLLAILQPAAAQVIFVDSANTAGLQDGLTWGTAFTTIQQALDASVEGNEIWFAKGEYNTPAQYSYYHYLTKSLSFYGGFSGNETEKEQRQIEINKTQFVSYDAQGSFRTNFLVNNTPNLTLTFDGIHFTKACQVLNVFQSENVTLNLKNCQVSGFNCGYIINFQSSGDLYIDDSRFYDNSGDIEGVYNQAIITNSSFTNNSDILFQASCNGNFILSNCQVINNPTFRLLNVTGSSGNFTMADCLVEGNGISSGGTPSGIALSVYVGGENKISNTSFLSNHFQRHLSFSSTGNFTGEKVVFNNNVGDECIYISHLQGKQMQWINSTFNNNSGRIILALNSAGYRFFKNIVFENNHLTGALIEASAGINNYENVLFSNIEADALIKSPGVQEVRVKDVLVEDCQLLRYGFELPSTQLVSFSNSTFSNITFSNTGDPNSAFIYGYGNNSGQKILINDCRFQYISNLRHGALKHYGTYAEINNSTFSNISSIYDGGVLNSTESSLIINNSLFERNSGANGGVIKQDGTFTNSNLVISNSVFQDNSASAHGGVILQSGIANIQNCKFLRNNAGSYGGVFYCNGRIYAENCIFNNNSALAGSVLGGPGTKEFRSSLFYGNQEGAQGTELNLGNKLYNCIIWNNSHALRNDSYNDVRYSNVQGGHLGEGNMDVDPKFVDEANGDFRLSCESPLLNKGINEFAATSPDLLGTPRIMGGLVDMGPYEFPGDPAVANAVPAPAISFSNNNPCKLEDVQFNNLTENKDYFTYIWNFGDGSPLNYSQDPLYKYKESGDYTVSLTATNACDKAVSVSASISVKPAFVPDIFYPKTVCPGDTSSFTTNAACSNLLWAVSGGIILNGQGTDKIIVQWGDGTSGNGSISLNATSCGNPDVCEFPVEKEISIVPSAVNIAGDTLVCSAYESSYFSGLTDLVPGALYTWRVKGGNIIGTTSAYALDSINIKWSSTDTLGIVYLDIQHELLECSTTDSLVVRIRPTFSITGSTIVCASSERSYSVNKTGQFQWSIEGAGNSIDPGTGYAIFGADSGAYTITARSLESRAFCHDSASQLINVIGRPVIDSITGITEVDTVSLYTYTAYYSGPNSRIAWTPLNFLYYTSTENPRSLRWDKGEPFGFTVYAQTKTGNCQSETITYNIIRDFVYNITGPDTLCISSSGTFTVNEDTENPSSYIWKLNGVSVGTDAPSVTVEFLQKGYNTVSVEVSRKGKLYKISKRVYIDYIEGTITLDGQKVVSPDGGGTYDYTITNLADFDLHYSVAGAVSHSLVDTTLTITWDAAGPHTIIVYGTKPDKACTSVPAMLSVTKAPALIKQITVKSGTLCPNSETVFSIETDTYTSKVKWTVSSGGTIVRSDSKEATILWGNTPGDFEVKVSYERFGKDSILTTATVNPLPEPVIEDATVCGEDQTELRTVSAYGSYIWSEEPGGTQLSTSATAFVTEGGYYKVQVTNGNGCIGTSSKLIKQVPYPKAKVTLSPSRLCLGTGSQTVTLSTVESATYSYQWYKDNQVIAGAILAQYSFDQDVSTLSSHDYKVQVSSDVCVSEATENVRVVDCSGGGGETCPDVVSFTVSGCQPFAVTNTSTQTDGFTWSFGDGFSSADIQPAPHSYDDIGFYTITLRHGVCASAQRKVEVPVLANFTVPAVVCQGMPSEFTDYSLNLPHTQIDEWTWDFGDGTVINGTGADRNTIHTYLNAGTYTASLIVKGLNSAGSICEDSYSLQVTIHEAPVVDFAVVDPSCNSTLYNFTNLSTQATSQAKYEWDLGNGVTSGSKDPSAEYDTYGDKTVTLKVTDFISCINSASKVISVSPPVEPQVISVTGNLKLCDGDSVLLTSPVSETGYSWKRNDQDLGLTQNEIYVKEAGSYTVEYGQSSCLIITESVTVTRFALENTEIQVSGPTCPGSDVIVSLPGISNSLHTVFWQKDTFALPHSSASFTIADMTAADEGLYLATVKENATECFYTLPSKTLTLSSNPVKPLISSSKSKVCYADSTLLGYSNPIANPDITWYNGSTALSEKSDTLRLNGLTSTATYNIHVTDLTTGCSSTSDNFTVTVGQNVLHNLAGGIDACENTYASISSNLSESSFSFVWYRNDVQLSTATRRFDFASLAMSDTGSYYAVANTNNFTTVPGCSFISDTVEVAVKQAPAIPLISGDTSFCEGSSVVLQSSETENISWNTGETTETITVIKGGTYNVTVTDITTGCKTRNSLFVQQNPRPDLRFVGAGEYERCASDPIRFSGLDNFTTYQWKLDGVAYGKPDWPLYPRKTGKYTVSAITDKGCAGESDTLRITSLPCACIVMATDDGYGNGSLREAIECANAKPGLDFIHFAIEGAGPFTIALDSALPAITEEVVIDGFSQTGLGVYDIILTPGLYKSSAFVFDYSVSGSEVRGIQFEGFDNSILFNPNSNENIVAENKFIGSAKEAVNVSGYASNNIITENTFEGIGVGKAIVLRYSSNASITNNSINGYSTGVDVNNSLGNRIAGNEIRQINQAAIKVSGGSSNAFEWNKLFNNAGNAFYLTSGTYSNSIINNKIGTDSLLTDLGNGSFGIYSTEGAFNSIIEKNYIGYNDSAAISTLNGSSGNFYSKNIILENKVIQITNNLQAVNPGNSSRSNPVLTALTLIGGGIAAEGKSAPGDTVQIFRSYEAYPSAVEYFGKAVAGNDSLFTFIVPVTNFKFSDTLHLSAIATDTLLNSSEFSNVISYKGDPNCLVVRNTKDAGIGSLRAAIGCANHLADHAVISFDLTQDREIFLETRLPDVNNLMGVTINGPALANPVIINGKNIAIQPDIYLYGLSTNLWQEYDVAKNDTIRNVVIRNFPTGINLSTDNSSVENCIVDSCEYGIVAKGAKYSIIRNNLITNCTFGSGTTFYTDARKWFTYNITFQDNTILNYSHTGISLGFSDTINVKGNYIGTDINGAIQPEAEAGISLSTSYHSVDISDNIIGNNKRGINHSISSENITIRDNYIGKHPSGTFISNSETGMYLYNIRRGVISGNTVSHNKVGIFNLIGVQEASDKNVFLQNVVSDNDSIGFLCDDVDFIVISKNEIFNNGEEGLVLKNSPVCQVTDNLFFKNGSHGVSLSSVYQTRFEGNKIGINRTGDTLPNRGNGILVVNSAVNSYLNNTISNNLLNGFRIQSASDTLRGNIISGNGFHGIQASFWHSSIIHDNIINDNDSSGVSLNSSSNSFIGGSISGNGSQGLNLVSASGNYFDDILIIGNDSSGVRLINSHGNAITGGEISGNKNGITTVSSSSNKFYDGTVKENTEKGIVINSGTGNEIRRCTIYENGINEIDLDLESATPGNNGKTAPIVDGFTYESDVLTLHGTSGASDTIEVFIAFSEKPSSLKYIDKVVSNASGEWTIVIPSEDFNTAQLNYYSATATDAQGTSEFSNVIVIEPGCTVVSTEDSGPGTLRRKIVNANSGLCPVIDFDISPLSGEPDTIRILTKLPDLVRPVIIDATTESGFSSNSPSVVVKNETGGLTDGLVLSATGVSVNGLGVTGFNYGFVIDTLTDNNVIENCTVENSIYGILNTGDNYRISNNSFSHIDKNGIIVSRETVNTIDKAGVITDNAFFDIDSIAIYIGNTSGTVISGNQIGNGVPGANEGIYVSGGSSNRVENNIVSNTKANAVHIIESPGTFIFNNKLGVDNTGNVSGNAGVGIKADSAVIISGNTIVSSKDYGIIVSDNSLVVRNHFLNNETGGVLVENEDVRISENTFDNSDTLVKSIDLAGIANLNKAPANFKQYRATAFEVILSGNSAPGDTVEIFLSENAPQQALQYVGKIVAAADSSWSISIPSGTLYNPDSRNYYVNTATAGLNTSELSRVYISGCYSCICEVVNADDNGLGSLRAAVDSAHAGACRTITFNMDPAVINLNTPLRDINVPVVLQGVDGIGVNGPGTGTGLNVWADYVEVSNISFTNWAKGISLNANQGALSKVNIDQTPSPVEISGNDNQVVGSCINCNSDLISTTVDIGIFISGNDNILGAVSQPNSIENAVSAGIQVDGGLNNTILYNPVTGSLKGIEHVNSGNSNYPAPSEMVADTNDAGVSTITGKANPGDRIQVFLSDFTGRPAYSFVVETTAATDSWTVVIPEEYVLRNENTFYIVTATSSVGNTSQFSEPVKLGDNAMYCIVTNTLNEGLGSLRSAVDCANEAGKGAGAAAYIVFDLPPAPENLIEVLDSGFVITNNYGVTIDPNEIPVKIKGQTRLPYAFYWEADKLDIKKLAFENFSTALKSKTGHTSKVSLISFVDNDTAVAFTGPGNIRIEQNKFTSGLAGIHISNGSANIMNNHIGNDTAVSLSAYGIVFKNEGNSTISGNTFKNIGGTTGTEVDAEFIGKGLSAIGGGSYIIVNNTFYAKDNTIDASLYLKQVTQSTINDNIINNGINGLFILESENINVNRNRFNTVTGNSIALDSSTGVTLSANRMFGLPENAKPIHLDYGTVRESNEGIPVPAFEYATYKKGNLIIRGSSGPGEMIEIFETNADMRDMVQLAATVTADRFGKFEYIRKVHPDYINDKSYRATATVAPEYISGNMNYYTSEASEAFNPNLKICFVTKDIDDNDTGTFRYNIHLANRNECNLMLFEVPGTSVNISPDSALPVITAEDLTIDATSQPGYINEPVVYLDDEHGFHNILELNTSGGVSIHGMGYNGFKEPVLLDSVKFFESSLSAFVDFEEHAIAFELTEPNSIRLDSNSFTSATAAVGLQITSKNVLATNNIFRAGTRHAVEILADYVSLVKNDISHDNPEAGTFAVSIHATDSSLADFNVIDDYPNGILARHTTNMLLTDNQFGDDSSANVLHKAVVVDSCYRPQVFASKVYLADTALVIRSSIQAQCNGNRIIEVHSIGISVSRSDSALISSNTIEQAVSGLVLDSSSYSHIRSNRIFNHDSAGVIIDTLSEFVRVNLNRIGSPDLDGGQFSTGAGLLVFSSNNIIGEAENTGNIFSNNFRGGVIVSGGTGNRITYNVFYNNDSSETRPYHFAIDHENDGNNLKEKPEINTYSVQDEGVFLISGTSEPDDSIHIYRSEGYYQNARYYMGVTRADGSGNWSFTLDTTNRAMFKKPLKNKTITLVATATDAGKNTSKLSDIFYVGTCYISNNFDNTDDEFPYPNSFRQAVACANSQPVKAAISFAIDGATGFDIGLRKEMITFTNIHGLDFDGANVLNDSLPVKVFKSGSDAAFSRFWAITDSVGASRFENLKVQSFDTAMYFAGSQGTEIAAFEFLNISDAAVVLAANTGNYSLDSLTINDSQQGALLKIAGPATNIELADSEIKNTLYGIIANGADTVLLTNNSFEDCTNPVHSTAGSSFDIVQNTFELGGVDKAILFTSTSGTIRNNTFNEDEAGTTIFVSQSKNVHILENKFPEDNLLLVHFNEVDSSSVIGNEFGNVKTHAVLLEHCRTSVIQDNIIAKLDSTGYQLVYSDSVFMSRNIITKVGGNYSRLINLNKGAAEVSNLAKPEPVIEGYEVKREKDCSEEHLGIYLVGQSQPLDHVEIFVSDTLYTTFTTYVGAANADSSGNWQIRVPESFYERDPDHVYSFTATGTDSTLNNTSQEALVFRFDNIENRIVVKNTADTGAFTLRQAIDEINCSDIFSRVYFEIEELAPYQITLKDSLPNINAYLGFSINGTTQAAFNEAEAITGVDSTIYIIGSSYFRMDYPLFIVDTESDSSEISNLVIKDAGTALKLYNSANRLENLNIHTTTGTYADTAIVVEGGSNRFLTGRISGYERGVVFTNGAAGNAVKSSEFSDVTVGVVIEENSNKNRIDKNTFHFDSLGVLIQGSNQLNFVTENTFGSVGQPLRATAVRLHNASSQFIEGNRFPAGINLLADTVIAFISLGDSCHENQIVSNKIGIGEDGLLVSASNMVGIRLQPDTEGQILSNNVISSNQIAGLTVPAIEIYNAEGGSVQGNFIGVDSAFAQRQNLDDYSLVAGIDTTGMYVTSSSYLTINANTFVNFAAYALELRNSESITMTANKMFSEKSELKAINLNLDNQLVSNGGIVAPEILANDVLGTDKIVITGTCEYPSAQVQIYEGFAFEDDTLDHALRYIKTVIADSQGNWVIELPSSNFGFSKYNKYIAQVTNGVNSSELSHLYTVEGLLCKLTENGIDLLDTLFEPCPESNFEVDAVLDGLTYKWYAENVDTIRTRIAALDSSAFMTLKISDDFGCEHTEEFEVRYKGKPIQPKFIVSTNNYVSDTLVLVDVSLPVPESYDWSSSDAIEILSSADIDEVIIGPDGKEYPAGRLVKFIVPDAGEYTIEQRSLRNGCFVTLTKTILAEYKDPSQKDPYALTPGINSLVVYPSPVQQNGNTNAFISTTTKEPVIVEVVNSNGVPVFFTVVSGKNNYNVPLNLTGQGAGLYIVRLITATTSLSYKLVIQ